MTNINRRQALKLGGAASIAAFSGLAGCIGGVGGGTEYPDGTITLISNYPEGSATFALAHQVGSTITRLREINVEVEAIGGAAGLRGVGELMNRRNDGYTFSTMYTPSQPLAAVINPPGFDIKDAVGITDAGHYTFNLIAYPGHEFESFENLRDRYNDGEFNTLGGLGFGHSWHVACAIARETIPGGWDWNNFVTFDGTNDSVRGTAAGEVPASTASTGGVGPELRAGNIDGLANFYSEGDPYLPEVPSWVDDLSLPNIDYIGVVSYAFLAPPGLDEDIREIAIEMFTEAIEDDGLQEWAHTGERHHYVSATGDEVNQMMAQVQEEIPRIVDLDTVIRED